MKTRVEHLPIELWISIFHYLEVHDIFQAFMNLNRYFDHILASNHLSFYVKLKNNNKNYNQLSMTLFQSNTILNRIIYIEGVAQGHSQHIPQFLHTNADKLIRLRSLNIKIRLRQETLTCKALEVLKSLEYLSIECAITQPIIEAILSMTSLRVCKLIYQYVSTSINYTSNRQSNIEVLFIKDYYNQHSITNILLAHMPKLKRLEISESTSIFNNLELWFNDNYVLFEKLETIKIKSSTSEPTTSFFKQLHSIMSFVKCLYIDIGPSRWDENLLENLIYHSWSIIEQIQRTYIYIRGYIYIDPTNNGIRKKCDNYREILLSKNNQSNRCFKIEWTEKCLPLSTTIEIIILKF